MSTRAVVSEVRGWKGKGWRPCPPQNSRRQAEGHTVAVAVGVDQGHGHGDGRQNRRGKGAGRPWHARPERCLGAVRESGHIRA